MSEIRLIEGDCLDRLKELDDNSVDSIVTDPPYGLSFMGKAWDKSVPSVDVWEECLRVLKPGGHLLAFAGTRTQHRMAVNIEDAGFEIRDMIAWVYGSGFPKSHDISKAIDKTLGAEREKIGSVKLPGYGKMHVEHGVQKRNVTEFNKTSKKAETQEADMWNGWGTALKPALEPITVARKPIEEKSVAANVLKYGTGGINIDESRIATNPDVDDTRLGGNGSWKTDNAAKNVYEGGYAGDEVTSSELGRFPANLIHDGSDEVTELFPVSNSARIGNPNNPKRGENHTATSYGKGDGKVTHDFRDSGSAARFFYCAKTSKKDRSEGVENNNHPTVKPTDLMQYLVRMVTPKGGTVLDPFMGSGSTGKAAKIEGFNFVGIELDNQYVKIAESRIKAAYKVNTVEDFFE